MILLLDIGNSAVKWAILVDGSHLSCLDTRVHGQAGITHIAEAHWRSFSPYRVVASNVAGEALARELCNWVRLTWRIEVEFLRPCACAYGVVNAYPDPARLGADRWAALVGAAQRSHGPLCVVDCGTAITIDVLSATNVHLGGLIAPGLRLMRHALAVGTAGVRCLEGAEATLLARDTGSAVAGGTLYAVVALIDRVVADLAVELAERVTILLTGGDAMLVRPLLGGIVEYDADLVMRGLAVVATAQGKRD